jgi:protein tyrosine/serine phosphatase
MSPTSAIEGRMIRHVPLEGVDNFRDFGGYPTAHGRSMKRGRLFRSASHHAATDADLETIAALGIGVVVDLRRLAERERAPSRRHPAFDGLVIANDEGEGDSWLDHIRTSDLSDASFNAYITDYYRAAPFEARHVDLFRRYFQALDAHDGAILVHCAAGKDRTGLLVALTHHIAGVHRDDMVADYLLTNNPERFAARLPVLRAYVREISGREPSDEGLLTAMGVEAAYLDTAFQVIEAEAGGVDAYLDTVLGVTPVMRARLLETLLA